MSREIGIDYGDNILNRPKYIIDTVTGELIDVDLERLKKELKDLKELNNRYLKIIENLTGGGFNE